MLTSVENHHSSQQNDGGVIHSSSSNTYSEDIESEANSYFQRMLAEQHSIDDEMVQMLTRFKESSVKREQSIFDCMISNLLEEYMSLPKYPEKQLELAAILFGCIIKHKLVTHLPLGIALRCVLDALRKPADSKMFAFGTKALEQFISRLEEWPQYCNHILQISHLRSTHPKVVEYIDGVLARKSHGGNGNMSSLGTTVNELIGSNSSQPGQQLSSSLWLDPLQSALVEDGTKASTSTTTNSFTKPPIAASVQPTATSSADSVSLPKLQSAQSAPGGALSISSGFSRIQGSTTRFGSALNIETLETAADNVRPLPSVNQDAYGGFRTSRRLTLLSRRSDATPRNYGRMPLITDFYADNVRPDAYGGGVGMSRFTTNYNYGRGPPIRENFSTNSVRPLASVPNESSARPLQSGNMNHSHWSSSNTDAIPRNYGRTPLIMDFYADNVRPLPSVNEDAYGGGGVRMSGFTATTHNYDMQPLIRENISSNNVRPLPPVANDEKASLISDEFAVINITRPLSSINDPLYEWWNSDLEASKPPNNYGKAPMIVDFSADTASPPTSVNEDSYEGCEASNTGRGSLPVHPTQQKSTRLENSSFGSCFPWFRKRMQSGLLKK